MAKSLSAHLRDYYADFHQYKLGLFRKVIIYKHFAVLNYRCDVSECELIGGKYRTISGLRRRVSHAMHTYFDT